MVNVIKLWGNLENLHSPLAETRIRRIRINRQCIFCLRPKAKDIRNSWVVVGFLLHKINLHLPPPNLSLIPKYVIPTSTYTRYLTTYTSLNNRRRPRSRYQSCLLENYQHFKHLFKLIASPNLAKFNQFGFFKAGGNLFWKSSQGKWWVLIQIYQSPSLLWHNIFIYTFPPKLTNLGNFLKFCLWQYFII